MPPAPPPRVAAPPAVPPSPARATPIDARPTPAIPFQRQAPAASGPTRGPVSPGAAPGAKPPINPFLANDPNAKARRLARALISDLITYFPAKRDEGIRDGTLKELFKEEIKKSYQEYSGQVGKEFADSTEHFKNALNEILAGGNQIF
jgi:hypothetical protein